MDRSVDKLLIFMVNIALTRVLENASQGALALQKFSLLVDLISRTGLCLMRVSTTC